jgi:hypothetical protein
MKKFYSILIWIGIFIIPTLGWCIIYFSSEIFIKILGVIVYIPLCMWAGFLRAEIKNKYNL